MVVGTRKSKNMTKTRPSSWPRICLLIFTLLLEYSVGQSINTLTAESQVAIEGQKTTTLHCYYIPTNAVIGKYYWKKGDEVIARKGVDPTSRYSLSDPTLDGTAGYVSLTINAVSRQDTDSYTCGVNDESTGATILFQKNCTLNVYYLDKPTLSVLGGDLEVVRGSKVTMFCNSTDANPKSITRKWFHDNKMLENLKSENHTLEIESFDGKNEGQYTCKVENEFLLDDNGKISNSLILSLKGEATALPSTSSSGAIVATVVILAIVIIVILVVGYVIYSKKKEKRDINTIMKIIPNETKSHTLIQHLPDSPGDFRDVIHRNTNGIGILFGAGGVVLNNRAFLLLNDNKKYIMCRGIPDTTQASPITWDEEANVLIQTEKKFQLLSYAALPGIRSPYILVGVINVSKHKIKRRLVTVFPNRNPSFKIMNEIIKTLELNGSVEDLKFDYLSGKKLSTGRLVVGGWVKRKVETNENGRPSRTNEFRVKYLPLSTRKQADVENQSFSYQPFILRTENEIDWNIVYLKMENAEDNMRIQIIETDNDKVRAIVSLLQSCKVVYEGISNDNCATFVKKEETSTTYMPVVSVALSSDGKFVCVPAINKTDDANANHKETSASATKEPLNAERKQGVLAGLKNSVENLFAPVTNQQPQNENQNLGGTKDDNPNTHVPQAGANETEEEKTTDATTRKPGVLGKVSKTLSSIKSKKKPSSDAEYESVPTNEESNETPKEEKAAAVVKEKETEVKQVEDIQGTSQQEPDESTPCVHEEESKEKEKRRSFMGNVMHGITKPFKTEGKSNKKSKKETGAIEEELPSNQGKEKIKFEGLWHFLEDTTDNSVIRLKPIHASSIGTNYNPINILQNRSKVKCEQIVPFVNDGKSWFLMIYTTNFEGDEDRGHCIRYHVFSIDVITESLNK